MDFHTTCGDGKAFATPKRMILDSSPPNTETNSNVISSNTEKYISSTLKCNNEDTAHIDTISREASHEFLKC